MAYLRAYQNHLEKLVRCLPMDDTHFITKLSAKQLLPGDTESKINALSTQADKVSYFLCHVIKPALDIDHISGFDELLTIMQSCGYIHVKDLAATIESQLTPEEMNLHIPGKHLSLYQMYHVMLCKIMKLFCCIYSFTNLQFYIVVHRQTGNKHL